MTEQGDEVSGGDPEECSYVTNERVMPENTSGLSDDDVDGAIVEFPGNWESIREVVTKSEESFASGRKRRRRVKWSLKIGRKKDRKTLSAILSVLFISFVAIQIQSAFGKLTYINPKVLRLFKTKKCFKHFGSDLLCNDAPYHEFGITLPVLIRIWVIFPSHSQTNHVPPFGLRFLFACWHLVPHTY